MKSRRAFLCMLSIACLSFGVWATQLDNAKLLQHQAQIQEIKVGPRKSDTLVGKYFRGRKEKTPTPSLQIPEDYEDSSDCQQHCIECKSKVDCVLCEKGYSLIDGQCLESAIELGEPTVEGPTQKSLAKKSYLWVVWVVVGSGLFIVGIVIFLRCRNRDDPQNYRDPTNHENKMFEMTRKEESPRQNILNKMPVPSIVVHGPVEERTPSPKHDQELNDSEVLDRKEFSRSPPVITKSVLREANDPLPASIANSPIPGFDSMVSGNSPHLLRKLGQPADERVQSLQGSEDQQKQLEGSFNMTKKVQPTEVKPTFIESQTEIAEFNPMTESIVIDMKSSPVKPKSPRSAEKVGSSPESTEFPKYKEIDSQLFASNIQENPKK